MRHVAPWPFMCQLGIAILISVESAILMCSGNSNIRFLKYLENWQAMSYVMNTQANATPRRAERTIKSMLQYLDGKLTSQINTKSFDEDENQPFSFL